MSDIIIENGADEQKEFGKHGGGVLTFYIGDKVFGVEIKHVTDIIEIQHITFVPQVPKYIKGVINLRGKVIPVMSVRERFEQEVIDYDERTCIIVVTWDDISVGLIVDRVRDVINIKKKFITPPPANKTVNAHRFIRHITTDEEQVKFILDCEKIILDE